MVIAPALGELIPFDNLRSCVEWAIYRGDWRDGVFSVHWICDVDAMDWPPITTLVFLCLLPHGCDFFKSLPLDLDLYDICSASTAEDVV